MNAPRDFVAESRTIVMHFRKYKRRRHTVVPTEQHLEALFDVIDHLQATVDEMLMDKGERALYRAMLRYAHRCFWEDEGLFRFLEVAVQCDDILPMVNDRIAESARDRARTEEGRRFQIRGLLAQFQQPMDYEKAPILGEPVNAPPLVSA